jgi:hypothetical protein
VSRRGMRIIEGGSGWYSAVRAKRRPAFQELGATWRPTRVGKRTLWG